jgi:hypothetical protein
MDLVPTPTFTKAKFQTTVKLPPAKDTETTYPFQWLVYKPQAHAIEPFRVNEPSRKENTERR